MTKTQAKNIKAVCFDFGGVIELYKGGSIIKNIAELAGVSLEDFRKEFFKHNHLCNIGNLSWEDVILKTVAIFNNTEKAKSDVQSIIKESQLTKTINTELLNLFPILKQQGLKVGILSNHGLKLREALNTNGITKLVDEIIISSEIGFQKPHKEAFQVLFEKLNVCPEETVFIDDAAKSLEKANEIGYIPILFKNNEQLKNDLQNLGISW